MLSKDRYKAYAGELRKADLMMADGCEVSDTVRGSSTEPPYVMHTITLRGVDHVRRERNRLKAERFYARCAEVEAEIALAPDSVRGLLRARYVEDLNWDQVGQRFGLKPDTARIRVERWFELNEKPQP